MTRFSSALKSLPPCTVLDVDTAIVLPPKVSNAALPLVECRVIFYCRDKFSRCPDARLTIAVNAPLQLLGKTLRTYTETQGLRQVFNDRRHVAVTRARVARVPLPILRSFYASL